MARSIWIAQLRISDATAYKLRSVHQFDPDEIRQEIQAVPGLTYSSHVHPEYGWRALLFITIRYQRVLVVLFPTDDPEVWNLGSAYRV
jgi:hypothetical protein